jgi:hypothetical protein
VRILNLHILFPTPIARIEPRQRAIGGATMGRARRKAKADPSAQKALCRDDSVTARANTKATAKAKVRHGGRELRAKAKADHFPARHRDANITHAIREPRD